jgi:poly(A) polymerase
MNADSASSYETARWVVGTLREAGHEALLAGGCVRDMLLGRPSSDYDVATDATPQRVRELFRRVLLLGAKFGVAVVLRGEEQVEVATFRCDVSYSDGRRPDEVRFSSPRQDALRRDFTINGMFYDPLGDEVIDYVGGREDLQRRVVRTIGEPDRRFEEDYLRMIRAVRFTARLGFVLDPATARAIERHAGRIAEISGERVLDELSKMLSHASAGQSAEMLGSLGLARAILPELFAEGELWAPARDRVGLVADAEDARLALGALLAGLDGRTIGAITRRWGASNDLRAGLQWMSEHVADRRRADDPDAMGLPEFKRLVARGDWPRLERLWRAEERMETGAEAQAERIAARTASIDPAQIAPEPWVTGDDLVAMGMREGRQLGRMLRRLYDAQLDERFADRPDALAVARRWMSEGIADEDEPG